MQRKVKALAKTVKRKFYLGAQINPRGGDRHWSMLCLVLKGTNQGSKGKAKQMHTRKKRYRCLTVNALNHLSTVAIGRVGFISECAQCLWKIRVVRTEVARLQLGMNEIPSPSLNGRSRWKS